MPRENYTRMSNDELSKARAFLEKTIREKIASALKSLIESQGRLQRQQEENYLVALLRSLRQHFNA